MPGSSAIARLLLGLLLAASCGFRANAGDGMPELLVDGNETSERDSRDLKRSLGSVLSQTDAVFRAQSPPIVPLLNNRATSLVPVRRLSIPNPLSLVGNLGRLHGRVRGAFGTNFDGREMINGNVQLSSGLPIGIDSEFAYRTDERLRLADSEFWVGDFNLVYKISKIQWVAFRMGVGANWLHDGANTEWGFNSTVGFDFRIKDPWYVSTSLDWGTLGSEELFHWQITGGVDLGRLELFIGYDFHEIRSRERKTYLAGVGLWF